MIPASRRSRFLRGPKVDARLHGAAALDDRGSRPASVRRGHRLLFLRGDGGDRVRWLGGRWLAAWQNASTTPAHAIALHPSEASRRVALHVDENGYSRN
jgi:hypothetical protein